MISFSKINHLNCFCEICVMKKQQKKAFLRRSSRAPQPPNLVHSNVCGPLNSISVGGSKYFLTLTNDYSGKT